MEAAQWPHQASSLENNLTCSLHPFQLHQSLVKQHHAIGVGKETEIISSTRHQPNEKRAKLNYKEQTPNCPRCNSTNTKFCYYNNYSLSQPRYFCKACRRYWTEGGSLRNVPVGGGSRKNKRSSSSSSSSSTATTSLMISSAPQPIDLILPTAQTPLNPTFPFSKSLVQMDQLDLNPGSVFGPGFGFQELLKQPSLKLPWIQHGGFGGDMHHDQVHVCKEGHGVEENGMVKEDQRAPCLFWSGGSGALW